MTKPVKSKLQMLAERARRFHANHYCYKYYEDWGKAYVAQKSGESECYIHTRAYCLGLKLNEHGRKHVRSLAVKRRSERAKQREEDIPTEDLPKDKLVGHRWPTGMSNLELLATIRPAPNLNP
jgi:hypothetical protein